jgi:hypothetical protein
MKEQIISYIVGPCITVLYIWLVGNILGLPKIAKDVNAIRMLLERKESEHAERSS